jgi:hypothetical protein
MVTNFETITCELDAKEKEMAGDLIMLLNRRTISNPIMAPDIVHEMNAMGNKISQARLRKIVNYIRTNGIAPIIATSNGYYMSDSIEEIRKQVRSLRERASSIMDAANGLEKYMEKMIESKYVQTVLF